MSRRLRIVISAVVLILVAFTVYRIYDQPPAQVEPPAILPSPDTQPAQTVPQQSSTMPVTPNSQLQAIGSQPNGRYPYYLGISDKQLVTIYRWDRGDLLVVQETPLAADKLRQEERDALADYLGVSSEEEAWQRIEALSH